MKNDDQSPQFHIYTSRKERRCNQRKERVDQERAHGPIGGLIGRDGTGAVAYKFNCSETNTLEISAQYFV